MRIQLEMSTPEAALALGGGNPGALSVLARLINEGKSIDPDMLEPMIFLHLDELGIYEHRIWMLYKDVCGQDLVKTFAMVRATQLGVLDREVLNHAIDNMGKGLNVDNVLTKVRERLPNFIQENKEKSNAS